MSKVVTIPTSMSPFVVTINGVEQKYPAGATMMVPDNVAAIIELYNKGNFPEPDEENRKYAIMDDTKVGSDTWSSENIVDKVCPTFTESGVVVACEPVEGYPLDVFTDEIDSAWFGDGENSIITLYHSGKNLIGFDDFSGITATSRTASCINGVHKVVYTGGVTTSYVVVDAAIDYFKGGYLPAGTYIFSINQESSNGNTLSGCYATVGLEDGTTVNLPAGKAVTLTTAGTVTGYRCSNTAISAGTEMTFTLQIEVGSVATAYEPYHGQTYTADVGFAKDVLSSTYNWRTGIIVGENGSDESHEDMCPVYQHDLATNTFIKVGWVEDHLDIEAIEAISNTLPIIRNIPAFSGVNYLYCDYGVANRNANVTVTGKANTAAVIEKLTNVIIALGGNV